MVIVLQGRIASERLPGKGYFTFFGETIWERMCRIARAVHGADRVIFATGSNPQNRILEPLIAAQGVQWFVGDEDNVLQRYVDATADCDDDYLVRITCDNYLVQPDMVEGVVDAVLDAGADYGYIEPLSHFAGEVVRIDALRDCLRSGPSALAREHVTYDIRSSGSYKTVALPADFGGLDHTRRLTLDKIDDLMVLKRLEQQHPGLEALRCGEVVRRVGALQKEPVSS